MTTIRPVLFDGTIYVSIAMFGSMAAGLSSDDAAKYISAASLWYARNICTMIAAGLLALKMYRSTSYSNYVEERKANGGGTGNTDVFKKDNSKEPTQ